jgi:hypothetical protein
VAEHLRRFLESGPISWQSLKQKIVALSTCEAEYVTAATSATDKVNDKKDV